MRRAVFLDRDGTLIEDRGHLRTPAEAVFFRDTVPALRLLQGDFLLFIVTNQPGIAEGALSPLELETVNRAVVEHLARFGIRIERVYYCPHRRADGCKCIKPNPYFLQQAAREFSIDLQSSFTVGDHPHDAELARKAGATGIYVLTGHGQKHREELPGGVAVVDGIWEAALLAAKSVLAEVQPDLAARTGRAAEVIRNGGIVACPTETVYGLCANAYDPRAVARIFEVKRRPRFDPLIVHVGDIGQAESLATELPENAQKLIEAFWPGPLTLVLPKSQLVPDIVTAGLPTVAVRMPAHVMMLALICESGAPLAAPSANPFGYISPTRSEHVAEQLSTQVDMILEGGPCPVGIESTILSLAEGPPRLLRAGGVPIEDIESVVGAVSRPQSDPLRPTAPGQLPRHYAPHTPLVPLHSGQPVPKGVRAGLLAFGPPEDAADDFVAVEVLSPHRDLKEAAANLFAALRRLDSLSLDVIVFQPVPETGLGLAIADRLMRAAARWRSNQ